MTSLAYWLLGLVIAFAAYDDYMRGGKVKKKRKVSIKTRNRS